MTKDGTIRNRNPSDLINVSTKLPAKIAITGMTRMDAYKTSEDILEAVKGAKRILIPEFNQAGCLHKEVCSVLYGR